MKTIVIEGVIGWDYTAAKHRQLLDEAKGDDLDIQISSTGGSVYDGSTIKQLTEKYKRDYPGAKVTITTYGMAMSAASIIALSGDSHDVHEDSIYMIHNPWGIEIGDYRVMRKTADDLEKLSNMYARIYADKSKKSVRENRSFMDDESYFYGQEIIDAGYADKLIKKEKKTDKDESVAFAKLAIDDTLSKMKAEKFDFQNDLAKAVALITTFESKIPASAGINIKMEVKKNMTLEELKRDFPELYAQAMQAGRDEQQRKIKAHINFAKKVKAYDLMIKNIEENKNPLDEDVVSEYMMFGYKGQSLENRAADDPGVTGAQSGGDDVQDTKNYAAKLAAKSGLKQGVKNG